MTEEGRQIRPNGYNDATVDSQPPAAVVVLVTVLGFSVAERGDALRTLQRPAPRLRSAMPLLVVE
jgi:hypothetical protein